MIPDETGRFCLVCNKSVIDFSNKLPDEIQHFFLKNQGKKICGRFKNSQLDSVNIQIPSRILFSQTQYHKIFLLALFVVMGTSLFSCATANGDKKKIENIEVVDYNRIISHGIDDIQIESIENIESDKANLLDATLQNNCKLQLIMGTTHSQSSYFNLPIVSSIKCDNNQIYFYTYLSQINNETNFNKNIDIKTRPDFPGSIEQFYMFFANQIKIPQDIDSTKKINIVFDIEKDGNLNSIEVYGAKNKLLYNEIIKVLKLSPKWKPGEFDGEKIKMKYYFQVEFMKQHL